jgi:CheY-like chemotaxis protein/nitrogen-specific signal transduction histidine kinase
MAKQRRKPKRKPRAHRARAQISPRAVEAALAGIAHDIRTPLTGIVALAELLAASDLRPREREWANAVKSGAEHLAALSTLIVDAAKADAAGLTLRITPFSPRTLAEAVGQALAARAGNKDVKTETVIADKLPAMVAGDAVRLRAALENLADNAVKFTDGGLMTFTANAEPGARGRVRLVFTVTDSGIGMSAAELKRLFRPFAQASDDIARRYGGAGLGLAFIKRIAKVMGGDLKVTSKKGEGSTFRFTALVEAVPAQAAATPGSARLQPSRPLTLLCAEDNPYGRVVMNTILTELGHRVDFVETGEAAMKAAERGGYDAVLMDVTLAGVDGLAATRAIRALPGARGQVPVIGISGRGASTDEAAARAVGAGDNCLNVARAIRPLDDAHHVRHDAVQFEILRRIDCGDAGLLQRGGVLGRNDAADHQRHVEAGLFHAPDHVLDQRQMAAGQYRKPDHVRLFLVRGSDDLLRRQADALVDHLHAGIARAHRDLLGAVGMAVETRLADQKRQAPPELS